MMYIEINFILPQYVIKCLDIHNVKQQ